MCRVEWLFHKRADQSHVAAVPAAMCLAVHLVRRPSWYAVCGEGITSVYVYIRRSRFLVHRCSDLADLAFDTDPHNTRRNGALHRKSSCYHARHGRRHVEPQSTKRTYETLEDVLLASDQGIHTRRRRGYRLRGGLSLLVTGTATRLS